MTLAARDTSSAMPTVVLKGAVERTDAIHLMRPTSVVAQSCLLAPAPLSPQVHDSIGASASENQDDPSVVGEHAVMILAPTASRQRRLRKPDPIRFSADWWAARVEPEPNTGCHLWTGCANADGYGLMRTKGQKSPQLAHRVAYLRAFGEFDPALKVCHRCDTPSCVNPDHLFLGTQGDNIRDMFAKKRGRPQGRAYGWRTAAVDVFAQLMPTTIAAGGR